MQPASRRGESEPTVECDELGLDIVPGCSGAAIHP